MRKRNIILILGAFIGMILGVSGYAAGEAAVLYPEPKISAALEGSFTMTKQVRIQLGKGVDASAKDYLRSMLALQGITEASPVRRDVVTIRLQQTKNALKAGDQVFEPHYGDKAEGYRLLIKQDGAAGEIIIDGNDDRGLFYGIQSLRQLIKENVVYNQYGEDYPTIPLRGIVEGFYGNPWTHASRLAQFKFYGEQRLNTYIYAPKDDSYHRAKWREPYPQHEMARMQELITTAKANKVDFVFAISPGIDIKFDGAEGEQDFQTLLAKLNSVYAMGVRCFAVYYDDIKDKSAAKQAHVLNRLQKEFVEAKGDIKYLMTVPTEYFTHDMFTETNKVKPYSSEFSAALDKKVRVMYTGPGVVCKEINEQDIAKVSDLYGRKMAVWWNYPVNDYLLSKLALGPIYGLDKNMAQYSDALLINPMEHASLSKIALQTGAVYAWSPQSYDYDVAWNRAIEEQYADLAVAMKVFADHSTYMDKGWANCGRPDAPKLQQLMSVFWPKYDRGENISPEIKALWQEFNAMERAYKRLERELAPDILAECKPQLDLFGRVAKYNMMALKMIEAEQAGNQQEYLRLREITLLNQKEIKRDSGEFPVFAASEFLYQSIR